MVSTRHHPSDFPSPAPTYSTPKTSISSNSSPSTRSTPDLLRPTPSSKRTRTRSRSRPSSSRRRAPTPPSVWSHTPSPLTLLWLTLAIPLVLWDAGYVLLRPHTLPAGASAAHPPGRWHAPLWRPYALYASVDRLYGWDGWEERREGFVGAQSVGNVVETVGYAGYVFLVWWFGRGRVFGDGGRGERRVLEGPPAAKAVLLGFAVSVLTVGKTGLYGLNEYFSGWSHVGHNSARDLILLWIIPNGAWIVFPTYMAYHFAVEILRGLNMAAAGASGGSKKRR